MHRFYVSQGVALGYDELPRWGIAALFRADLCLTLNTLALDVFLLRFIPVLSWQEKKRLWENVSPGRSLGTESGRFFACFANVWSNVLYQ
jgi:hypothetical protein